MICPNCGKDIIPTVSGDSLLCTNCKKVIPSEPHALDALGTAVADMFAKFDMGVKKMVRPEDEFDRRIKELSKGRVFKPKFMEDEEAAAETAPGPMLKIIKPSPPVLEPLPETKAATSAGPEAPPPKVVGPPHITRAELEGEAPSPKVAKMSPEEREEIETRLKALETKLAGKVSELEARPVKSAHELELEVKLHKMELEVARKIKQMESLKRPKPLAGEKTLAELELEVGRKYKTIAAPVEKDKAIVLEKLKDVEVKLAHKDEEIKAVVSAEHARAKAELKQLKSQEKEAVTREKSALGEKIKDLEERIKLKDYELVATKAKEKAEAEGEINTLKDELAAKDKAMAELKLEEQAEFDKKINELSTEFAKRQQAELEKRIQEIESKTAAKIKELEKKLAEEAKTPAAGRLPTKEVAGGLAEEAEVPMSTLRKILSGVKKPKARPYEEPSVKKPATFFSPPGMKVIPRPEHYESVTPKKEIRDLFPPAPPPKPKPAPERVIGRPEGYRSMLEDETQSLESELISLRRDLGIDTRTSLPALGEAAVSGAKFNFGPVIVGTIAVIDLILLAALLTRGGAFGGTVINALAAVLTGIINLFGG